jgi:hypothetical protein
LVSFCFWFDLETYYWFWAVGIIAFVIIVLAVLFKNYPFAMLILIGTVTLLYISGRKPKPIKIEITNRYIAIGEEEKYYQDLKQFWIEQKRDKEKRPVLLLLTRKGFAPLTTIPLPIEINTEDLRQKLLKHMEEKEMAESGIYEMMEKLGF